jgi:hypothetical protein
VDDLSEMDQVKCIDERSGNLVANAITDAVLQARMLDMALCGLGAEIDEGGIGPADVVALREEVRRLLLTLKQADGMVRAGLGYA